MEREKIEFLGEIEKNLISFRIIKISHVCVPLRSTKCMPVRKAGEMYPRRRSGGLTGGETGYQVILEDSPFKEH